MQEWRLGKPCPSTNPDPGRVELASVNRNVWHQNSRIITTTPCENGLADEVRPIMYHPPRPDPPVGAKTTAGVVKVHYDPRKALSMRLTRTLRREDKKEGCLRRPVIVRLHRAPPTSPRLRGQRPSRSRPLLDTSSPSPKLPTPWLLQPPPPRFFASRQPRRSSETPWVSKKGGVPRRTPQFPRHRGRAASFRWTDGSSVDSEFDPDVYWDGPLKRSWYTF